uniref:Uncharacterized protein n=1 Tax=Syphacia muris TaxID=451379 RepID=A0A0N5AWM4_9BILA
MIKKEEFKTKKKKLGSDDEEANEEVENTIKFQVICDEDQMELRSNEQIVPISKPSTGMVSIVDKLKALITLK